MLVLQDAWRQYEDGAERLVEDLAAALAKQDSSLQPLAQQAATGTSKEGGCGSSAPQQQQRPSHQLMKALAVMEDHAAASIDPDRLTGEPEACCREGAWSTLQQLR